MEIRWRHDGDKMEIRGRWDTCKLNVSGVIYPVCNMSEKRSERLNVGGVSAFGLGTVLRLEMDAWSTVK